VKFSSQSDADDAEEERSSLLSFEKSFMIRVGTLHDFDRLRKPD
jgi:hypothetical protein